MLIKKTITKFGTDPIEIQQKVNSVVDLLHDYIKVSWVVAPVVAAVEGDNFSLLFDVGKPLTGNAPRCTHSHLHHQATFDCTHTFQG